MCGRAFEPRLLWMWPNARISATGGEQAAAVLTTVKADQLAREGRAERGGGRRDPAADLEKYEREGSPYYSTARLWDDGLLDPAATRDALAIGLSAALNAPLAKPTVRRLSHVAMGHLIISPGRVTTVTINRPEVRNALNDALIAEFTEWATDVAADQSVRVVVLQGAGPVFCAGADLTWMSTCRGLYPR